jgi:hypothetical protein
MNRRLVLALLLLGPLATPALAQRRNNPGGTNPDRPAENRGNNQNADTGEGRALWRTIREPRIECRPAVQYLTWQWTRYAGPGAVQSGSPLTAMATGRGPEALDQLVAGVSHNTQAVGVYRSCAAAANVQYLLWLAATSSERSCDMAVIGSNIAWQKQNNLPSLTEAMRHWRAGRDAKTVDEENSHALVALREMLAAVRHNPNVSAVYRACFRDRPEDFFQAVRTALES